MPALPLLSPELASLAIFLVPFCAIVVAVYSFRSWGVPAYVGALSGRGGTLFLGFAYILAGLGIAPLLATPDRLYPAVSSLQDISSTDPLFLPFGLFIFVIGSCFFLYTFLQGKPVKETLVESGVTVCGFFLFVYLARYLLPLQALPFP